jgi:hypothetical protein
MLKAKQGNKSIVGGSKWVFIRGSFNLPAASGSFCLRSLFDPEDGGDIFLRNVLFYSNYRALGNPGDLTVN